MGADGPDRMMEVVTALSVFSKLLADLVAKLASAASDEIPALADDAKKSARQIVECCMDTAPVSHLRPEEVAAMRAELVQLAETLHAEIDGLVDLRWAQIGGGGTSRTRH
jgi:hypothetical protein